MKVIVQFLKTPLILGFAVLFVLSGCLGRTPDSRFYILQSNAEQVSTKKLALAVANVRLPQYVQKPQIVLRAPDSAELKISEFDRWGSPLSSMFQNTLIENLQISFPNAEVKPLAYGYNAQYIIKVSVDNFSGWLKDSAVLSGNWQIVNSSDKVLSQKSFSFKQKVGASYDSYVQTQSALLAQLSQEIAQSIAQ